MRPGQPVFIIPPEPGKLLPGTPVSSAITRIRFILASIRDGRAYSASGRSIKLCDVRLVKRS